MSETNFFMRAPVRRWVSASGSWSARIGLAGAIALAGCSGDPAGPAATTTGGADIGGTTATSTGGGAPTTTSATSTTGDSGNGGATTGGAPTTSGPETSGGEGSTPGGSTGDDTGTTSGDGGTTGGSTTGSVGSDAGATSGSSADAGSTGVITERIPLTDNNFAAADRELVEDEPTFNVHRPADLAGPGFKLPVVAWANGGCLRADFLWHENMFKRWAAAGFVVLSLTGGDGSADDLIGLALAGQTDKTHQRGLVDWVIAANESGPYAGMLDVDKIIVAGNSCGGVTSIELAAEDDRVAGIFVLSGSSAVGSTNTEVMANIHVPLGFVVGHPEQDIAGGNALGDYEALNDGVPGMVVSRFEADHVTVSTDNAILVEVGEIALNWMDLVLYGSQGAYDALTSDKVCEGCTDGWWTLQAKGLESLLQ